MIEINIKNKEFEFRNAEYQFDYCEDIDGSSIHIFTDSNTLCFMISETTFNGLKFETSQEAINYLNK